MRILSVLILTFVISCFFNGDRAHALKTELKVAEKSTVPVGTPIRLGHLVQNSIGSQEVSDRIYNLVIFESFTDEVEKTFESQELALTLRQKLSFQDLKSLSLKIPETFRISARRNFLSESDLQRDIVAQARFLCSDCQIEFDELKIPEVKVKGEILRTKVETQALKSAGGFLLPLIIESSQGKNTFWITGKISFYKTAPVARRLLQANERIGLDDFEMKRINVSFARDGVLTAEDLAGKMTSRLLTLGQPIFAGDLKKEPAARRGQMVRILVGQEGFEIGANGVAEENGHIGEVIKVKSSDTQKLLSGVLVEKGVVRLQ